MFCTRRLRVTLCYLGRAIFIIPYGLVNVVAFNNVCERNPLGLGGGDAFLGLICVQWDFQWLTLMLVFKLVTLSHLKLANTNK